MNYDEALSNLEIQRKQFEVSLIKVQGAIEVLQQLKESEEKEEDSTEEEQTCIYIKESIILQGFLGGNYGTEQGKSIFKTKRNGILQ